TGSSRREFRKAQPVRKGPGLRRISRLRRAKGGNAKNAFRQCRLQVLKGLVSDERVQTQRSGVFAELSREATAQKCGNSRRDRRRRASPAPAARPQAKRPPDAEEVAMDETAIAEYARALLEAHGPSAI